MAQQQQNLQLFKTMLQQKEVYVMDLEDEVNNTFIFLGNARALMIRIIIQHFPALRDLLLISWKKE